MNYDELALEQHKAHKGKITTKLREFLNLSGGDTQYVPVNSRILIWLCNMLEVEGERNARVNLRL